MNELLKILHDAIEEAQETINYAFDEPYVAISRKDALDLYSALKKAMEIISAYDEEAL